jgi:hypothetical protein
VRPELDYRVSKLQQEANPAKATIATLREANKVGDYIKATSDRGLTFLADSIQWKQGKLAIMSVADASFGGEEEPEGTALEGEPYRSQGGRLLLLSSSDCVTENKLRFHVIGHASTTVKRVCRATVQAETYNLQTAIEAGDVIRAGIADLFGMVQGLKTWERDSAAFMPHVWFTDCNSTETALARDVLSKISDKRLGIEMAAMRQSLWRKAGDDIGDPVYEDKRPGKHEATDYCRWVDTDVMLADCLTKVMEPTKLIEALDSNYWDCTQPLDSIAKKKAKQLQRRKTVDEEPAEDEPSQTEGDA